MSYDLANHKWVTLSDDMFIGGHKIEEIWIGNHKIYPEGGAFQYMVYNPGFEVFNNEIHFLGTNLNSSGGVDYTAMKTAHVKFDGNRWVKMPTLPTTCAHDRTAIINGKLSFLHVTISNGIVYFTLNQFTNKWETVSSFNTTGGHSSYTEFTTYLNGSLYHFYTNSSGYLALVIYNANGWAVTTFDNVYRPACIVFYNNTFHAFGYTRRDDVSRSKKHYIYQLGANIWIEYASLPFTIEVQNGTEYFGVVYNNSIYFMVQSVYVKNSKYYSLYRCIKYNISNNTYNEIPTALDFNSDGCVIVYNNNLYYFYKHRIHEYSLYSKNAVPPFGIYVTHKFFNYNGATYLRTPVAYSASSTTFDTSLLKLVNNEWVIDQEYDPINDGLRTSEGYYINLAATHYTFLYNGTYHFLTYSKYNGYSWFTFDGSSISCEGDWQDKLRDKNGDAVSQTIQNIMPYNGTIYAFTSSGAYEWDGNYFNLVGNFYMINESTGLKKPVYIHAPFVLSDGVHMLEITYIGIIHGHWTNHYKITQWGDLDGDIICEELEGPPWTWLGASTNDWLALDDYTWTVYNDSIYLFSHNLQHIYKWSGSSWVSVPSINKSLTTNPSADRYTFEAVALSDGIHVFQTSERENSYINRDIHLTSNGWELANHYCWSGIQLNGLENTSDLPSIDVWY